MKIIGGGILLGLITVICSLGAAGDPADREYEDREQIRYLEEWRLKHEKKEHVTNRRK